MKKIIVLPILALCLAGCVTASDPTTLVPEAAISVPSSSVLVGQVGVTALSGDFDEAFKAQVSNEALSTALEVALDQSGLLADSDAKYSVVPNLTHLAQPMMGLDMKVTAKVNYLVKDASGKVLLDKTISSPYTAKLGDAFVGATRVRLANEGAVRENIAAFIEFLVDWAETKDEMASLETGMTLSLN